VSTIYLDPLLLGHPRVWAGAGSEKHVVGVAPSELARLARAQTADVVQAEA
jgi:prolyl-tRNA editing enzyme YbaK/EbsC (Cys-tRNA(Pro) deacylase)